MPLQLPKPVAIADQKLKLLVYGEPGIGKTRLSASAAQHPDMAPVLVLNLEGGLLSIIGVDGVDEIEIRSSSDMDEAYFALAKKTPPFDKYKTVVIDSGTNFANRVLIEWVQHNQARAVRKKKADPDRTIDDVQREDYGKMTAQIRRMLSWYVDLPLHVIVTALSKKEYPPAKPGVEQTASEPTEIRPAFTDKLGTDVMGLVDHVWYLYRNEQNPNDDNRYMLTQRSGIYVAKSRGEHFVPALGKIVVNPNLARLFDLLRETEGVQKSPRTAEKGMPIAAIA